MRLGRTEIPRAANALIAIGMLTACAAVAGWPESVLADDVSHVIDESAGFDFNLDVPGYATSLQLDSSEYPVIAYGRELTVMHCNDAVCSGDDELINVVDSSPSTGRSLLLDSSGNPVLSYVTDGSIKVAVCNDPACSGGDESISTFALPDFVWETSIQLDESGLPVVAFGGAALSLLRCNDPTCSGDDDPITTIDADGEGVSLHLDRDGLPVIAYLDISSAASPDFGWLKVARCRDPACTLVDINAVQFVGFEGHLSMQLDASGSPVISYWDPFDEVVKLVHCNDSSCTGGDETVNVTGAGGRSNSLKLDSSGNPVISAGPELVHCNYPACAGNDESLAVFVGTANSLQLDGSGNPVFSSATESLWLTRCSDPNCVSDRDVDQVPDDLDNCPDDANPAQADLDGDLIGDACDPDDDGDGHGDIDDAFPSLATEWADTDEDGIGDNADPDDDGDGQSDADEIVCGSDPQDGGSLSNDGDGNGIPDCAEPSPSLPPAGAGQRQIIVVAITALISGIVLASAARAPRSSGPPRRS